MVEDTHRDAARRILVVEDEATTTEMISLTLIDAGYNVVVAWDGEVALQRANLFNPHIIVLDLVLPIVSGWEFLAAYAGMPVSHAAVVVITGDRDLRGKEIPGVAAVFVKPFDLGEFMTVVRKLACESDQD